MFGWPYPIDDSSFKWIHQFKIVEDLIKEVREGKKPYYKLYLINPNLEFSQILFVLKMILVIFFLRLLLSGCNNKKYMKIPNFSGWLLKDYMKPSKLHKVSENIWYAMWHLFSFSYGIYVFYKEMLTPEAPGWARMLIRHLDIRWYWVPTPAEYVLGNNGWPFFPLSNAMKCYYLTELAFWITCILFLYMDTVRSDTKTLLIHHIATCILIFFSFLCNFWRVGIVTLITHDFADILLYTTKTMFYLKNPRKIVDKIFIFFIISFFLSRLVIYPWFCVKPILDRRSFSGIVDSQLKVPGGIILPFFLVTLQALHVFWFTLIMKMLLRTFQGEPVSKKGDIRSDSDNSDDDNTYDDKRKTE